MKMGNKKSKLSPKDLTDLAALTDFTEREIRVWYKSFKKDCPSGMLSLQEFEKLYKEFFPTGDASEFAKHAFRTFDKNGDGTIDFREFMSALSITSRGTFEQKLRWAYSMYDMDNDGQVTKKEMLEIVTAIAKMTGEDTQNQSKTLEEKVDRIFQKMDKDGDEMITVEEFKIAAKEDPSLVMILQVGRGAGP